MKASAPFYHNSIPVSVAMAFAAWIVALAAEAKDSSTFSILGNEDVIASIHSTDISSADKTAHLYTIERSQLIEKLLHVFTDPQSSNLGRCYSAYYLGELRAPEATRALAVQITLQLDLTRYPIKDYPVAAGDPVVNALIKIGAPSISPLIANLAASDDPRARELSLRAICQIERDQRIVRMRLEDALKAHSDAPTKKRLEAALGAIDTSLFGK